MSPTTTLRTHQRILWAILTWHFPAPICQMLEAMFYIHNDELHRLYSILLHARFKPPTHLLSAIRSLSDETAREMVAALADVGIRAPRDPIPRATNEATRIGGLFKAGYIGRNGDGSARENVASFRTLHVLYRLDKEDQRARKEEDTGLRDPSHKWYHVTSDEIVEKWARRLSPLIECGNRETV
ncbi:hypothetical protein M406DRAFT_329581 [Cryphonectria parasitica EP155]|uniref:Uncharacterized protein n=1 Tax=Cryphonectria parasitica (strain ATCC 38755 / EP155) TaxID=660469 RepID=A0A9P4Y364_CRYP1|nr:uncharacterized protein M406DRAFT_329581 [Cryphonectria parasitica EP155]KAF3765701.1 hypothetical protein M406DRAFT_329581 [Cryphonectria parasitica EP155]